MSDHISWNSESLVEQIASQYRAEGLAIAWGSEKVAIQAALRAIEKQLPENRYIPQSVPGVGGSGIVLRLSDTKFPEVDKALKFPRPVDGKITLLAEMLKKEIGFLAGLRHPGIVSIMDYGTIDRVDAYPVLPFYIMDFVDGESSRKFVRSEISEDEFYRLVRDTAETLAYLHAGRGKQFAHLDLKAENIMVTRDGRPVMIDLGTCKQLRDETDKTIVASTRSNAHPQLIDYLQADPSDDKRAKGEVPRRDIRASWDLWAFGLTILDWLGLNRDTGDAAPNGIYPRFKNTYARKYYMLLIARLLNYSVPSWLTKRVGVSDAVLKDFEILSAVELCEILDRLVDRASPLSNIEELATPSSGTIQAASELHVASTPALTTILEHRLFRRLNSVTQLGFVSQVYPAAKHSRKEHSLGTYANVVRMLRALYQDSYSPLFKQIVTEDDCRALLLATLLHDLGHFPLAHELEEIDDGIFRHSELTLAMIKGEWRRKKRGSKPISFDTLSEVFKSWRTTPSRVMSILAAKPTVASASNRDKLLRSFFSGPIDADKLDYLARDAKHTDVPYPLGIDVGRLLRCLTVVVFDGASAHDVLMIGVHSKGKVAAESVILARQAMFSQVYWHHAVRAQKAMLARAVGALLAALRSEEKIEGFRADFLHMVTALPENLYTASQPLLIPEMRADDDIKFETFGQGTDFAPTDAAVLAWFGRRLTRERLPEAKLTEGVLKRRLFKRLWVLSHDMDAKRWDRISDAWNRLSREPRNKACHEFEKRIGGLLVRGKIASVTTLRAADAEHQIEELTAGEIPWLLIDIPSPRPGAQVGLQYVLEGQRRQLRKDDRAVGELQSSEIWERYAEDLQKSAGKIRVFCDPTLADTVESSIEMTNGLDELEAAVMEVTS